MIVATPSLMYGVNLPSKSVIIRDYTRWTNQGPQSIPVFDYEQMSGRAGRPLYDKEGYSYLLAKTSEEAKNLEEIYSLNVLPEKYRSFEAVATLYGYIVNFRCTIVKGDGGIYDTYEKDLIAGIIINKLSNIEASIYRIEGYQRELVNQARIANNQLASINSSLESINNYSAEIAKNSQISAVASQQSAAALQWQNYHMWSNGF